RGDRVILTQEMVMSQKSAYPVTHHHTRTVDGIKTFYREAGPKNGPTVLLLHGFPTSSHMFRRHRQLVGSGQPDLGGRKMPQDFTYPMPQISAQMWNLWVLEALCSAAVT